MNLGRQLPKVLGLPQPTRLHFQKVHAHLCDGSFSKTPPARR